MDKIPTKHLLLMAINHVSFFFIVIVPVQKDLYVEQ